MYKIHEWNNLILVESFPKVVAIWDTEGKVRRGKEKIFIITKSIDKKFVVHAGYFYMVWIS